MCPCKQRPAGQAAPGPGGLQFSPPAGPSLSPPPGPAGPAAPTPPLVSRQGPDSQARSNAARGGKARQSPGSPGNPSSALSLQAEKASWERPLPQTPTRPAPRTLAWADAALVSYLRSHHNDLRQLDDVGAHRVEDILELVDNRN